MYTYIYNTNWRVSYPPPYLKIKKNQSCSELSETNFGIGFASIRQIFFSILQILQLFQKTLKIFDLEYHLYMARSFAVSECSVLGCIMEWFESRRHSVHMYDKCTKVYICVHISTDTSKECTCKNAVILKSKLTRTFSRKF